MADYHVYGIGNALVDMEFAIDEVFLTENGIDKGVMTLMDEDQQHDILRAISTKPERQCGGGSAANTIFAISQFGGQCFYSCKVANDEAGHFYLSDLETAGVNTSAHQHATDGITGKCIVLVTPDSERTLNTFLGISGDLSRDVVDPSAIAQSQYVYLEGYLSSTQAGVDAVCLAKSIAEEKGVKTALSLSDPNMVKFFKPELEQMIGNGVDLLFSNQHEALSWANTDSLEQAVEQIKKIANTFVITLGSKGALAYDGNHFHEINATPVNAIDANGAGDMFAGGFLYGITHGMNYMSAGQLGGRAAAKLITEYGARLLPEQQLEILADIRANND